MADTQHCPFCKSPRVAYRRWLCGTTTADGEEFSTGAECDKSVFRDEFLACVGALRELLEAVEDYGWGPETPHVVTALRRAEDVLLKHDAKEEGR